MKIIGVFLVKRKNNDLVDAVTCFIDLDSPFNHYVEPIHPCSSAFDQEEENLLFVQLHGGGPEFEVTLVAEKQKLILRRESWEGFKAELVNSLNREKTDLVFVGLQEFQWRPNGLNGPLDEDMMSFKGNCFITFDEGKVMTREYYGISGVTMQKMTVRTAYRDIDLVNVSEGQFIVKDLKDFQSDICLSLPRWAKNGLTAF